MMIAVSIVIYKIALADGKSGWIWIGVNLAVTMVLGKLYGLGVMHAFIGGAITMALMFVVNFIRPLNK